MSVKMNQRKIVGNNGEQEACNYLKSNNYTIMNRNFRCRSGEIDIIANDDSTNELVFIEVKTRKNFHYGMPAEAVTRKKQKHIVSATKYYLFINKINNKRFIRFDVIEVINANKTIINHIKNARMR